MSPNIQDQMDKWFIDTPTGALLRKRHQWNKGNGVIQSNVQNHATADVNFIVEGKQYMQRWYDGMTDVAQASNQQKQRAYHAGWQMEDVEVLGQGSSEDDTPHHLIKKADQGGQVYMLLSDRFKDTTSVTFKNNCDWNGDPGNQVAVDDRYGNYGSIHQKITVFKNPQGDWAIVGSVDIDRHRWGRREHKKGDDPERPDHPGRPTHEAGVKVTGDAVSDIEWEFFQRYNDNSRPAWGAGIEDPTGYAPPKIKSKFEPTRSSGSGNQRVQVLLTYGTGNNYSWRGQGEFTVWASYLNALRQVQNYAYIEGQFFSPLGWGAAASGALTEPPGMFMENDELKHVSLFYQLKEAMARGATLFAVIPHPDMLTEIEKGGYYAIIMEKRHEGIRWLRKKAKNLPGDIHVAYPANGDQNIYVHSKLLLCDDEFTAVGSANFNQRSMTKDGEMSLGILDENGKFTMRARQRLWNEHMDRNQSSALSISTFANAIQNDTGRLNSYPTKPPTSYEKTQDLLGKGRVDPNAGPNTDKLKQVEVTKNGLKYSG